VQTDTNGYYEGGFITPAKWKLPRGLENVLAAQAMFPVTSPVEMAGQKGENPIADARSLGNAAGAGGIWELIAERLQAIPEYVELFKAAFPERVQDAEDITYVLAANAIAAFETDAFRADDSPFDRYLRDAAASLDARQQRGMELFYGRAECSSCHAGTFQTDHDFYAIAMPQIGPGKGDGGDATYWAGSGERGFVEDFGRGHVTVRKEDRFKFRTPTLRNVELTAPYGHDGAYETLEEVIRHHGDPAASLESYAADDEYLPPISRIIEITVTGSRLRRDWLPERRRQGFLMRDTWVQRSDDLRSRIAAANELEGIALSDADVADLLAFMSALTDPSSRDQTHLVPDRVPSGLPVENE
jgi:cytochrome c peroxidase